MGDALHKWAEIYDAHAPRIFRYVYHRLGDQALAEDLTSEVFVRFLNSRTAPENVSAFLYRIAHNLIVDHLRRNPAIQPLDEAIVDRRADPTSIAEAEAEKAMLRRAIAQLTPEQQQVIVLRFLEGLETEQVAEIVGKSVGAVKAMQHRALATLRDLVRGTR